MTSTALSWVGEPAAIFGISFSQYVVQIITGLGAGAVLFLIASGLTLVFGALRVINFAHGSLFMLGAYITTTLTPAGGLEDFTFWLIFIAAALVVAAGGLIMEVFFFRPIYRRPLLTQLLVTFAFVLIIAGIVRFYWGPSAFTTSTPPSTEGSVAVLDGRVPKYSFIFMGSAVAVALILWAILYKTALGRMIRAAVSDPTLLRLSGINVRMLYTSVFVLAAFFAGLAGAIFTLQGAVSNELAVDAIIRAFVVVVIGGLGSIGGAFIAAALVGVAEALGILWVPQASLAIVFAVLVIVLVIRPQGIMGTRTA